MKPSLLLAAIAALASVSCFAPDYSELQCNAAGACPDGYTCKDDACVICPAGYDDLGILGSCYRLVATAIGWSQAEADCEDDSAGATTHLAVLDDATELAMLDVLVSATKAWIGMSDRIVENNFLLVTGGPAVFLPWAADEPNDSSGADCVVLEGAEINDSPCFTLRVFVCEYDGKIPVRESFLLPSPP